MGVTCVHAAPPPLPNPPIPPVVPSLGAVQSLLTLPSTLTHPSTTSTGTVPALRPAHYTVRYLKDGVLEWRVPRHWMHVSQRVMTANLVRNAIDVRAQSEYTGHYPQKCPVATACTRLMRVC